MKDLIKKFILVIVFLCGINSTIVFGADEAQKNVKWYDNNRLIAHALGVIEGRTETNSLEAFEKSYEDGHRVMEADFSLTSDGILVVRHDFLQDSYYTLEQKVLNKNTDMNIERYVNEKICFKFTPLTAKDIIKLLDKYKDVYLVTDTKNTDVESVKRDFGLFVSYAKELGLESVLDRVIVQIYNDEMLEAIKGIYNFENWIYTLYQTKNPDYNVIGDFCLKNGIDVVTIEYSIVNRDNIKVLNDKGIKVYTHTVNKVLEVEKAIDVGVFGVYTDIIKPKDLSYIGLTENKAIDKKVSFNKRTGRLEAYKVDNEDYVNIRDLGKVLNGSEGKFNMVVDEDKKIISISKGEDYVAVGGEGTLSDGLGIIVDNSYSIVVDNVPVQIKGYKVYDEFYFKLGDLGKTLDFDIAWSGIYAMDEIILKK